MVKNLPYNAGDAGLILGQGTKIPHATRQLSHMPRLLSSHTSTRAHVPQATEPTHPGAYAPQPEREDLHAATREKPVHHSEEPACLNEDPPCAATKTQ